MNWGGGQTVWSAKINSSVGGDRLRTPNRSRRSPPKNPRFASVNRRSDRLASPPHSTLIDTISTIQRSPANATCFPPNASAVVIVAVVIAAVVLGDSGRPAHAQNLAGPPPSVSPSVSPAPSPPGSEPTAGQSPDDPVAPPAGQSPATKSPKRPAAGRDGSAISDNEFQKGNEIQKGDDFEKGLVLYADAANLQNGGAIGPAIETWQQFLDRYPAHPRHSDAAHYLGVCHMQIDPPDLAAAAAAFKTSTAVANEMLREKSLVNLGWCLYRSATDDHAAGGDTDEHIGDDGLRPRPDHDLLDESIATFSTLVAEFPKSEFIDRAFFYRGEAAYAMGNAQEAVQYYDKLLTLPSVSQSVFRCDGYYARGVALESLGESGRAIESYRQFLAGCGDEPLAVVEVQLRVGDLLIAEQKFDQAIAALQSVIETANDQSKTGVESSPGNSLFEDDVAYALYRKGYAAFAAEDLTQAIESYERLIAEFPASDYAADAMMSSGQAAYRAGRTELAAERFEQVAARDDLDAAIEASHWLSRMRLAAGDAAGAEQVAQDGVDRIAQVFAPENDGDSPATLSDDDRFDLVAHSDLEFRGELLFDLGQSIAADPERVGQSIRVFMAAAGADPDSPLAGQSLYNAAFSAVSAGQNDLAIELSDRLLTASSEQTLETEVRLIRAEALMAKGQNADAAEILMALIEEAEKGRAKPTGTDQVEDRIGAWALRAATALSAADRTDEAIALVEQQIDAMLADEKVFAKFSLGQWCRQTNAPEKAAQWFEKVVAAEPQTELGREAALLAAVSFQDSGDVERAVQGYRAIVSNSQAGSPDPSSEIVDQARFKLAAVLSQQGDYAEAAGMFDPVASSSNRRLAPYAMLGRADALARIDRWGDAAEQLSDLIDQYPDHGTIPRALYDRGFARSALGETDSAKSDLRAFLETDPDDDLKSDSLYELALLEQADDNHVAAAQCLWELVEQMPNFDLTAEARYRLGWSQWKSGDVESAEATFDQIAGGRIGDDSSEQADEPENNFRFDATVMLGEIAFEKNDFAAALQRFEKARASISARNETAQSLRDRPAQKTRELVLLHGGQSAAQLGQYDVAIEWYDDLRERFPANSFLPELFYELGAAWRERGDQDKALKFFGEVVDNYRTEVAARSRFMRGEIYFAERRFNDAIGEFQRLMFGFGSDLAPENIKPWQARAGFEAGRCSELLASTAATDSAKKKAVDIALRFYRYVVDKHPGHELAAKANQRIEALER